MGSLTVRRIDDRVKARLRVQAARAGRSLEEEVRRILLRVAGASETASDRDSHIRGSDLPLADNADLPAWGSVREPAPAAPLGDRRPSVLGGKRILLIIGGGIAAYKCLDLVRRLRERGARVRAVMTDAAQEFVTPLSVGAVAGEAAYTDLFDLSAEFDIGHIRLARDADLVVVAPATADLMAKMAHGLANDLASTILLATDKKVLIAPAMNPRMWANAATARNLATLRADGIAVVGPNVGEMAEAGESGLGRMAEPLELVAAIETALADTVLSGALAGKRVLVTSGPTYEAIDPVRYIANRSSGKQGFAIARAAAAAGAAVTLISGPVTLADPPGVAVVRVESARDMLAAVEAALPADIAIFAAAVADWRVAEPKRNKMKKGAGRPPSLALVENPDILATIAGRKTQRPKLVIGFAAETENVIDHAKAKLAIKGCDWILANDVSAATGVMGGDRNTVHLVTPAGVESWPTQSKDAVARMLVARIAAAVAGSTT